jgi:hypothetical protein
LASLAGWVWRNSNFTPLPVNLTILLTLLPTLWPLRYERKQAAIFLPLVLTGKNPFGFSKRHNNQPKKDIEQ